MCIRDRSWADPVTGRSPEFWGRSMGWIPVALLDELEAMPADYKGSDELRRIVREMLTALLRYQDCLLDTSGKSHKSRRACANRPSC